MDSLIEKVHKSKRFSPGSDENSMMVVRYENIQDQRIARLEEDVKKLKLLIGLSLEREAEKKQLEYRTMDSKKIYSHDEKIDFNDKKIEKSEEMVQKNVTICDPKDQNELTLAAFKGKNWNGTDIDKWLGDKLEFNLDMKVWEAKNDNLKETVLKVVFRFAEHREYIWQNRLKWFDEGVWYWDVFLTPKQKRIKMEMKQFGKEQSQCGKKVKCRNDYVVVNNEKWVWVDDIEEIVKLKVANLLTEMKEELKEKNT